MPRSSTHLPQWPRLPEPVLIRDEGDRTHHKHIGVHIEQIIGAGRGTHYEFSLRSGTDEQISAKYSVATNTVHTTDHGNLTIAHAKPPRAALKELHLGNKDQTIITDSQGRITSINNMKVTEHTPPTEVIKALRLDAFGHVPLLGGRVDSLDGCSVTREPDPAGSGLKWILWTGTKTIQLDDAPTATPATKTPIPRQPGPGKAAPGKPPLHIVVPGKVPLIIDIPTHITTHPGGPTYGDETPEQNAPQRHSPPAQTTPDSTGASVRQGTGQTSGTQHEPPQTPGALVHSPASGEGHAAAGMQHVAEPAAVFANDHTHPFTMPGGTPDPGFPGHATGADSAAHNVTMYAVPTEIAAPFPAQAASGFAAFPQNHWPPAIPVTAAQPASADPAAVFANDHTHPFTTPGSTPAPALPGHAAAPGLAAHAGDDYVPALGYESTTDHPTTTISQTPITPFYGLGPSDLQVAADPSRSTDVISRFANDHTHPLTAPHDDPGTTDTTATHNGVTYHGGGTADVHTHTETQSANLGQHDLGIAHPMAIGA